MALTIDARLRRLVLLGERDRVGELLDAALAEHAGPDASDATSAARALVSQVLLPAMREVRDLFSSGEMILPRVLQSAEVIQRALWHLQPYLGDPAEYHKGSVVVATAYGDVHDIGKSLLVAVLATSGYTVHDLGKQVPVDRIVDAAVETGADAIGLSALLVTTSAQMPLCIQELDRRAVHLPVLIGGAAINRTFGRRAAILPDGRVYAPAVFYCKDVFEGVSILDALTDPAQATQLIRQARAEIESERDRAPAPPTTARVLPAAPPPPAAPPTSVASRLTAGPRRDVEIPRPPFWGARRIDAKLPDVWRGLDRNTLFRYHWGGYRVRGAEYERIIGEVFEPELASLTQAALHEGWIEALIVSGYFPCNALGDELIVFDPRDQHREVARLTFPRQPEGERLCLADYFRPVASGERDVLVLQAVSAGARAGNYVEQLQHAGDFSRMLYVNGLASATAEALADYAHNLARAELGLSVTHSLRFSWGYAACPDLADQRLVLPLLNADSEIGLTLSLSNNLDPEHSTAAMLVHHPGVKYFSVRGAA